MESYVEDLQNDYLQGINNYPQTLNESYKILCNWTSKPKNYQHLLGNNVDRVNLTVDGVSVTEDDVAMMVSENKNTNKGKYMASKKCYNCNKMGHISRNCPKKNKSLTNIDGATINGPNDKTETGTTDRPPDRKIGTVSLMAAVERG